MDVKNQDTRSQVLQTTLAQISSPDDSRRIADPEECCVICLDRISEQAEALPCQHKNFDFLCLLSWLEQRTTCPLCNAEILRISYGFTAERRNNVYNVPQLMSASSKGQSASLPGHHGARRRRPYRHRNLYTPPSHHTADEALLRRRYVYRNNLYSLHVGSNRLSRFRDLTPQLFSSDLELTSRARKWIRRELQVFEFLAGDSSEASNPPTTRKVNNVEFLLEYIIAILKTVDTQGSGGQAEDMLQEFLGRENTRLFLHELRAWLRSPYVSLADWDRAVQYAEVAMPCNEPDSFSEQRCTSAETARGRITYGRGRTRSSEQVARYRPYNARQRVGEPARR